jgi:hypothetical protein
LEHLRLEEKVLEADRALAEGKLEMQILCSELQKVKHLLKLQKAEASKKKSKCRLLRVRAKNLSRSISLSISAIRALEIEKDEAELIAANARAAAIRHADLQKQFDDQTRQLNLRLDAQDEQSDLLLTETKKNGQLFQTEVKKLRTELKTMIRSIHREAYQNQQNLISEFGKVADANAKDAEDSRQQLTEIIIGPDKTEKTIVEDDVVDEDMSTIANTLMPIVPTLPTRRTRSQHRAHGETKTSSLPGTTGGGGAGARAVGVKPKKKKNIIQYNRENVEENSRSRRTRTCSRNTRKKNGN